MIGQTLGMPYELAQVNIARLVAPLDDPQLADFVAPLDPVNAAPGSVHWSTRVRWVTYGSTRIPFGNKLVSRASSSLRNASRSVSDKAARYD